MGGALVQLADQRIALSAVCPQTASMLKALSPAAVLLAVLAFAGPAAAQDPATDTTPAPVCTGVGEDGVPTCTSGDSADQTIGGGQVTTDPPDQAEGPTAPDDGAGPGAEPKTGEQHVLGEVATAGSPPPAAARPATVNPAAAGPKTLPFTGVDAGPLVLMGAVLLLTG